MNSAHVLSILHHDETKCAWVKSAASSELMMIQLLAGSQSAFPAFSVVYFNLEDLRNFALWYNSLMLWIQST